MSSHQRPHRCRLRRSHWKADLTMEPAIQTAALTFQHKPSSPPSLVDINLSLPYGSRTVLIGANGGTHSPEIPCISAQIQFPRIISAGKSTLLQLLAGKRLVSTAGTSVRVKGQDVFRNTPEGVTFLGTEWSATAPYLLKPPN